MGSFKPPENEALPFFFEKMNEEGLTLLNGTVFDKNRTEEELEQILKSQQKEEQVMLPIDDKMVENINLVTNFDCWMGHTNFNITESVKETLNKTEGVEALKICSRYRFFVGIGKMFDFKEVRRNIENKLLRGENIE